MLPWCCPTTLLCRIQRANEQRFFLSRIGALLQMFGRGMGLHGTLGIRGGWHSSTRRGSDKELSTFMIFIFWAPLHDAALYFRGLSTAMARRRYYHSLIATLLMLLWIALDTTEASPLLRVTTQLRKRGRRQSIILYRKQTKKSLVFRNQRGWPSSTRFASSDNRRKSNEKARRGCLQPNFNHHCRR